MMLRRFALTSTPAARSGAILALCALAGAGVIASANTEAVVAKRFTVALGAPSQQTSPSETASNRTLVSGTEAYWLSERQRLDSDGVSVEPAAWSGPMAPGLTVGDRFTLPGGKAERVLQVVAIADIEPTPGTLQSTLQTGTAAPGRQIAITCRDLTAPDGHTHLVTFVVPAGTALASQKQPPQTL